jgi:hypothetical protein
MCSPKLKEKREETKVGKGMNQGRQLGKQRMNKERGGQVASTRMSTVQCSRCISTKEDGIQSKRQNKPGSQIPRQRYAFNTQQQLQQRAI